MAASSVSDASKEAAFVAFEAEFVRNGFRVPEGLVRLLRNYKLKPQDTPDNSRHRLYRYLWTLLWFGSGKTLGASGGRQPTYVYPASLKRVVRELIPGEVVDQPDPTHDGVYKVNIVPNIVQSLKKQHFLYLSTPGGTSVSRSSKDIRLHFPQKMKA